MNKIQLGSVTLTYDQREGEVCVMGTCGMFKHGMLPSDWDKLVRRYEGVDQNTRNVIATGTELVLWLIGKAHRNYTDSRSQYWKERKAG